MGITFVNFFAMLLLAGFVIRFIETTWPDTTVAKALLYLY